MDCTGGGKDYDSGSYSVKFDSGITEVTLNVSIIDDDILEGNEKFNLTVNVSSLPNKVIVSDPGQATVTIVDNDGKSNMYNYHSPHMQYCMFYSTIQ